MEESIISGRMDGPVVSIRERLRRRRRKEQLRTAVILLGLVAGAAWTIVFGAGFILH